MQIHFFKNREEERINFDELIDNYFDRLANSNIISDDEQVNIEMRLPEFKFSYHFYITKRASIRSVYKLNPNFVNTNMFIEIDPMIPTYISRKILEQVGEICERFHLHVYSEKATDIQSFNMFNLISDLSKEKASYISSHNEYKQYRLSSAKLNDICQYQSISKDLSNYANTKMYVKPSDYQILYDKGLDEVKLAINWKEGTPAFFPPYLDYILVEENDALMTVIPAEVFYKYTSRLMYDLKCDNINIKILYLNDRCALKANRFTSKMRKQMVSLDNFSFLNITDLIEA